MLQDYAAASQALLSRDRNHSGSLGLKSELWQSQVVLDAPLGSGSLGLKSELWQSHICSPAILDAGSLGLKSELWQS
ncbi:MAG: hypothetical protein IJ829_04240, partial [Kiritimatiellae bacterium]|nr:hypothetical protein [Kiritimatiellia bacterium]